MDRRVATVILAALFVLPLFPWASVGAQPDDAVSKISDRVMTALQFSSVVGVVIEVDDGPISERQEFVSALTLAGARDVHAFQAIPGLVADIDADTLRIVADLPWVRGIGYPGYASTLLNECGNPLMGDTVPAWWLKKTRVQQARLTNEVDGEGQIVAILDTGVSPAAEGVWAQYRGRERSDQTATWRDFIGSATGPVPAGQPWPLPAVVDPSSTPVDACGHGTAVASMVVDAEVGAAPGAEWIGARIGSRLGSDAWIDARRALEAYDWLLTLPASDRPDVIVNSWGLKYDTSKTPSENDFDATTKGMFLSFIQLFHDEGIVAVFASGNDEDVPVSVPADYPGALAVGRINEGGGRRGPIGPSWHDESGNVVNDPAARSLIKPDLMAPGQSITAAWSDGTYRELSGSSFAAPLVAGIALLAKQAHPELSADEITTTLLTASNFRDWAEYAPGTSRPNNGVGFGLINAMTVLDGPEGKPRRILLIGDYDDKNSEMFESWKYDVTSIVSPDSEDLQALVAQVDNYGILVVSNVDATLEYPSLFQAATAAGTGIVLLGDPGLKERDGVELFVAVSEGSTTDQPVAGTMRGKVATNDVLHIGTPAGSLVDLRTGSTRMDSIFVPDATVTLRDSTGTVDLFALVDESTQGRSRAALLSNAGASGVNSGDLRKPATNASIRDALDWVRTPVVKRMLNEIDRPLPLDAEVIVVGDYGRRLSRAIFEMGYTVESVEAWDLDLLYQTILAANLRAAADPFDKPIRLIVYNDIVDDFGGIEYSLADVEGVRTSPGGAHIPVLILGGRDFAALTKLSDLIGYAPSMGGASPIEIDTPHAINDFALTGERSFGTMIAKPFTLPTGWTSIYRDGSELFPATSGFTLGAVLEQGNNEAPLAAVIGFGGTAPRTALDPEAKLTVQRAVQWMARNVTDANIIIDSLDDFVTHKDKFRLQGENYLLNGMDFQKASLTLNGADFDRPLNLTVQNSFFKSGNGLPTIDGIVIENWAGRVDIEGNSFVNRNNAILVTNSPDVHIHHNRFTKNSFALASGDATVQRLARLPIDAPRNFFAQVDVGTTQTVDYIIANGPTSTPGERLNLVDAGFQIVPFYTKGDFTEPYPADGLVRRYLGDQGQQDIEIMVAEIPTVAVITYETGRQFAFSARDPQVGTQLASSTVTSPPGWIRREITLPPGTYELIVSSDSGRGEYFMTTSSAPSAPKARDLDEEFGLGSPAGWSLTGTAHQESTLGYRETVGLLAMGPAPGTASRAVQFRPHGLTLHAAVRPASDAQGEIALLWDDGSSMRPIVTLPFDASRLDTTSWAAVVAPTDLPAGSWSKVEARIYPPWADVYLNNNLVGTAPVAYAPFEDALEIPGQVRLTTVSGSADFDHLRLLPGEALSGILTVETFEEGGSSGGGGIVVLPGTGGGDAGVVDGRGATTSSPVDDFQRLEMASQSSQEGGAESSQAEASSETVDMSPFAKSGGTVAYANTRSFYLESSGDISDPTTGTSITRALAGGLRRYALEEYVSLPEGESFSNFQVMSIVDAQGATIFSVSLDGADTFLDVQAKERIPNVARLDPGQWHKVRVVASEQTIRLFIDDKVVLTTEAGSLLPPASWQAGGGSGRAIFDNLRFGYPGMLQSDPSAAAALTEGWTVVKTAATGIVSNVATVPEKSLPTDIVGDAPLASHAIRVFSPTRESSMSYMERNLPVDLEGDYNVSVAFYLPKADPLVPLDTLYVLRLESEVDGFYSVLFWDADTAPEVEWADGYVFYGQEQPPWNKPVSRESWHQLDISVHANGSVDAYIDGSKIRGMPTGVTSAKPVRIIIGDMTGGYDPFTSGRTGSGDIYIDDLRVTTSNNPPSVAITTPSVGEAVGGITTLRGTSNDIDPGDAVSNVTLQIVQGTTVKATTVATGTTTWSNLFNTTVLPFGAYALHATASDGRANSAISTRAFTIDNRPSGGVTSPPNLSTIGGIVTVHGTATSRFPLTAGEPVDSARYRIDFGPWQNLTVQTGSWNFTWNTSPETKGTHKVTVEAKKWLDVSNWTMTYTVDNSPQIVVSSPAAGATLGGTIMFTGTATDSYTTYEGDIVDSVDFKINSGPWQTGIVNFGAGAVASWNFSVDSHSLVKGLHALSVRGYEDGDERIVAHSFRTDNTPVLVVSTPESGASVGERLILRGTVMDLYPSTQRPLPEGVVVKLDSGVELPATLTADSMVSGKASWRYTLNLTGAAAGAHTVSIRAFDGNETVTTTLSVTVNNAATVALTSGVPRFDFLGGPGLSDHYTISVPTDGTELNVTLKALEPGAFVRVYARLDSAPTTSTYDAVSSGDGTQETLLMTPITGLRGGTWYFLVQSSGAATDYRVLATVKSLSQGCTGVCV